MPERAFRMARDSHGLNNPTFRLGLYVPTRREVAEQPAAWLQPVLIDWLWECPAELIPSDAQLLEIKAVLLARPDSDTLEIKKLVAECDDCISDGKPK